MRKLILVVLAIAAISVTSVSLYAQLGQAYVGAAQVIGDEEAVKKVEAVAQLELNLPGRARAKVLIPVDKVSLNVTEMQRVYDVGVSAVIDLKL